jgi:hypothetical protein
VSSGGAVLTPPPARPEAHGAVGPGGWCGALDQPATMPSPPTEGHQVSVDDPGEDEQARRVALHRRDGIVDDHTEPRGVGVGVVARHEEVLRSRRLDADEESHLLATHGETVRDVLRERRV